MRQPERYIDWPAFWPPKKIAPPDLLMADVWSYFGWSPPDIDRLIHVLESQLEYMIAPFEAEHEVHASDPDERELNREWCSELVMILDDWCQLLNLSPHDLPLYEKALYQRVWNEDFIRPRPILDKMRTLLREGSNAGDLIFRPRCLEHATGELMRWLQSHPSDVDRVHHRTFESIVAEVIREGGWEVELTKKTRDGGFDLMCISHNGTGETIQTVVEVKLYDLKRSVGICTVDRLVGVASREKADRAVVVTNSRFTQPAWSSWQHRVDRDLNLIDREELLDWLSSGRGRL